jgi:hypothetical protein
MDRRERIENLNEMLLVALQGWQADIWTALPGIVQSFDPVKQTCEVQPAIRFKITDPALQTYQSSTMVMDPSGQFAWEQMPKLLDCPVVFPGGGGVTLTFPIKPGDEVLVVIASRCIDSWWQQGGIQNQNLMRMHDLSDGFVIPQPRSQKRVFTVSTDAAQLRTDDGSVAVELNPTTKGVKVTTTGDAEVTATNIKLTGSVKITGALEVTGGATIGGIVFGTHRHTGVQTGGGVSGGPI